MNKIKHSLAIVFAIFIASSAHSSGMDDDPLITFFEADQHEYQHKDGANTLVWDINAWIGRDLNKFWLKTEGKKNSEETESAEIQLLYGKAISPFWDVRAGISHHTNPKPSRDWAVIGVLGVAPYLLEVDASLFIGKSGRLLLSIETEYEYMFSQRLVLSPKIELTINNKDDAEVGNGKGLSEVEFGLRLSYEIEREFAPYIGLNWEGKYGNSADFAKAEGEKTSGVKSVIGVRYWF